MLDNLEFCEINSHFTLPIPKIFQFNLTKYITRNSRTELNYSNVLTVHLSGYILHQRLQKTSVHF